jgi:hypothetical protein
LKGAYFATEVASSSLWRLCEATSLDKVNPNTRYAEWHEAVTLGEFAIAEAPRSNHKQFTSWMMMRTEEVTQTVDERYAQLVFSLPYRFGYIKLIWMPCYNTAFDAIDANIGDYGIKAVKLKYRL